MENRYTFLILILPSVVWVLLPPIYSPWYIENLLSSPFVILVGFLILMITLYHHFNIKMVILCFALNCGVIGATVYKNITKKERFNCSDTMTIFQFNNMYNASHTDKLIRYLEKERYDLVALQEISPQVRKTLIKALSPFYPYFINGISNIKHIETDQLIFSQYRFTHTKYHQQFSASHLIQTRWHIGSSPVQLFTLHSPSPRTHELWRRRNLTFYQSVGQIKLLANEKVILVGDFNLSNYSSRIEQFSEGISADYIGSWPNLKYLPAYFTLAIDHVFVSDSSKTCSRERINNFEYSDHYPILTKIVL